MVVNCYNGVWEKKKKKKKNSFVWVCYCDYNV